MKMGALDWIVWVLLFVGGLNWGLVGAFDFNLVTTLFGEEGTLTSVVYILVGLAAVWSLISMFTKGGDSSSSSSMGAMK